MFTLLQSVLVIIIAVLALSYAAAITGMLITGTKTEIKESHGVFAVISLIEVITPILYLSLYRIEETVLYVMVITWIIFWIFIATANSYTWLLSKKNID